MCIEWFCLGWTLAFTESANGFIGNLSQGGLVDTLGQPSTGSTRIPALLFALYQCTFAMITPAIAFGSAAERGRLGPLMLLVLSWSIAVYSPVAHSTWSSTGFLHKLGSLDFAGMLSVAI